MSTQQRVELLAFGYVNEACKYTVPVQLIKLIQLFYGKYFYWILQNKKLKQLINAKNGEEITYLESFKIKGIEFKILLYPNGDNTSLTGLVVTKIGINNTSSNIEYVQFYQEIKCETLSCVIGIAKRWQQTSTIQNKHGGTICQLSDLKNETFVCFSCMINIQCIKYSKDCDKRDYYLRNIKMQKHCRFTWNIDNILTEKCKQMMHKRPIYSDNFDNDKWCLILYPKGYKTYGKSSIVLRCLYFPFTVRAMDVKFRFIIDGIELGEKTRKFQKTGIKAGGSKFMGFEKFKQKESLSFTVILEIIDIYNENDQIINENEWDQHGVNCITQKR
eukprot:257211_1